MSEIIQILHREHRHIATLVKTLEWQIARFETGALPDYDVISGIIAYFEGFPDRYHHPKEDLIYALLKERSPEKATEVGDLPADHDALAERTRELSAGVRAVLEEAHVPREALVRWAREFISLQRQHMETEEQSFFPVALSVLTEEDWKALESVMTTAEDPLVGENIGAEFNSLLSSILRWQQESESQAAKGA